MPRLSAVPISHPTDRLVGQDPAIEDLRAHIRHLARFDTVGSPSVPTVLLQGETGTGKGLVAGVLHDSGPRARGPFLEVNCAAIPDHLLEAELFGFEAGAFTDAKRAKPSLFEAAAGGSLFLDEIDALPLLLQSKLLKAIEEKWVRRVGAVADRPVDVKIIAATQADLPARVEEGRFRLDLYHRLAVVLLTLPSLRERGEDILGLARETLRYRMQRHGIARPTLGELTCSPAASIPGEISPVSRPDGQGAATTATSPPTRGQEPSAAAGDHVPSWEYKPVAVLVIGIT